MASKNHVFRCLATKGITSGLILCGGDHGAGRNGRALAAGGGICYRRRAITLLRRQQAKVCFTQGIRGNVARRHKEINLTLLVAKGTGVDGDMG
jgi:hypothetical protein